MKLWQKNTILVLLVVLIAVIPVVTLKNAEFGGSDDQAEGVILEQDSDYEPWFESVFEPASGEIESLLFCTQAALGAGIVGFVLGRLTAKKTTSQP